MMTTMTCWQAQVRAGVTLELSDVNNDEFPLYPMKQQRDPNEQTGTQVQLQAFHLNRLTTATDCFCYVRCIRRLVVFLLLLIVESIP